MCGIAGEFDPRSDNSAQPQACDLVRMRDALIHRGPDGAGLHLEPHIGLAHRRLAIIDLAGGQQPVFNEDGSVVVVFNGEIYNFRELSDELIGLGHVFRSRCDTEVLVHAWEQWGERCVERLNGMFAFAIWDRPRQTLFLARDRLGVKPLYYAHLNNGNLVFASELKSIKQRSDFDRGIDPQALEDYLAFGYIPDPRTIYRRAHKLPPGHTLVQRVGARQASIRRYWDVTFSTGRLRSLDDAAAELLPRLASAVASRMIADVPLGAFLSGGIDSGSVVALMARQASSPVATCSIGFDEPAYDESALARRVADRYETDHHERIVRSSDFEIAGQVATLYDEPFADSSAIPTFRVCELAREHVTVALSGDGGDELFGGYRRYRLHLLEERLRSAIPGRIRGPVFGRLGEWCPKFDCLPRPFRAKTTLQSLGRDTVGAYFHSVSVTSDDDRARLITPGLRRSLADYNAVSVLREHADRHEFRDPLALIQYLDYKTYLPGDINTKVDRASMAHSLEVRDPLMDHQLIDWVAPLPSALKANHRQAKILLKAATGRLLPDELLNRAKMGFAVPISRWFRSQTGYASALGLVDGPAVRAGLIDGEVVREFAAEHGRGVRERSATLWSIYCLDRFLSTE